MNDSYIAMMKFFLLMYCDKHSSQKSLDDYKSRDLVCTPYVANYGHVSGWVLCVEGTPPKGTLLIFVDYDQYIFFIAGDMRPKRVNANPDRIVIKKFFNEHLDGKKEAFTIKGE